MKRPLETQELSVLQKQHWKPTERTDFSMNDSRTNVYQDI